MSEELYIPSWWRQALTVEYLPCRDYTKGDRISKFDFSMITDDMVNDALEKHKMVSYGTIMHNVDAATLQARSVVLLVSPVASPIVNQDVEAIIPQGLVSKYHFTQLTNPLDVCDPIETFGSHIQVLDNNKLYQWEIAKFEGVKNRNYGRWTSEFTDLSRFDEMHETFHKIIAYKNSPEFSQEAYIKLAKSYIEEIQELRASTFEDLYNTHEHFKKKYRKNNSKAVDYNPPPLSHFETMKIENGHIYTTCSIAPIFFRASLKHCNASKKTLNSQPIIHPHMLDEIYEERAQAVIMAAACLEAIANEIGSAKLGKNWDFLQKLSLIEKLQLMYSSHSPSSSFDNSKHPFQFLSKIVSSRNDMIHFKSDFSKCKVIAGTAISKMESVLNTELIEKLPKVLIDSINTIYTDLGFSEPPWTKNQANWKVI